MDNRPPPSAQLKRSAEFYSQVQAFIDAAEEVDIDEDVIEDILDGLDVETELQTDDEPEIINGIPEHDDSDSELSELESDAVGPTSRDELEGTWKPQQIQGMLRHLKEHGMGSWLQEYVVTRQIPIPKLLLVFGIDLCPELQGKRQKTLLYFLRVALHHQLRLRERLTQYSTIDDAVDLVRRSQRIVFLTGAGISVSCGIPDFRSHNGLYAVLQQEGKYDLDDPQQMFDINYFRENPAVFYSFASQIYPSNFVPSPCHRFIKAVEDRGKLLRNYTQNIDTLETLVGIQRVLQCHGSFATATCINCRQTVKGREIEDDIMAKRVALCKACHGNGMAAHKDGKVGAGAKKSGQGKQKKKKKRKSSARPWDSSGEDEEEEEGMNVPTYPPGVMKPDITFFGEKLNEAFEQSLKDDFDKIDLLIVMGTSLKVAPVADVVWHIPHSVPQILINKTPVRHINPDIILLGDADEIVEHLCHQLHWPLPPPIPAVAALGRSISDTDARPNNSGGPSSAATATNPTSAGTTKRALDDQQAEDPTRVGSSHIWLFPGAEAGEWLADLSKAEADKAADGADTSHSTSQPESSSTRESKKPKLA